MVSPIYPGGMYPLNSAVTHGKKHEASCARGLDQRYDQVQFSHHLDETEKRMKETVGQISRTIRLRPARQELEELRQQVISGSYQPDPQEIAARMLLREDG